MCRPYRGLNYMPSHLGRRCACPGLVCHAPLGLLSLRECGHGGRCSVQCPGFSPGQVNYRLLLLRPDIIKQNRGGFSADGLNAESNRVARFKRNRFRESQGQISLPNADVADFDGLR